MISISVDQEQCKKCYSCIAECPFDLINQDKEGFPQLRKAAIKKCIRCGHCMAVCLSDALDITVSPFAESPVVDKGLLPSPESVEHFLLSRRSIRTYKKRPAGHSTLKSILDISRYAPSAHNAQPVHWLMVENPDEVRRLAGMVVDWMTELKVFPGLTRAWTQGQDKVLRGAPHLAIAHADPASSEHPIEDCTLATAYLDLAAHSQGLGSCWAGFLVQAAMHYQPIIDALDLPENHQVYTALMLGYPKFRYRHIPQRDELKIIWR
ncbi:MAG: nitroreductase family protein [Proteobacteria bacterium]|nr:nitroreductase family protein [Pseudomonadota bacterium]MBU1454250.1 nitroreductase family protein [Pseudomonadota bacterium]